jgi:ADP-ribosylglycohydrolase
MASELDPTTDELPVTWGPSVASGRRGRAAEGIIIGAAIGEALALARDGLKRRKALILFGRSPLSFRFHPGLAIPGECTHNLLIAIQAILESKADHRSFGRCLQSRLNWYRLSMPLRQIVRFAMDKPTDSNFRGLASNPLLRALSVGVLVQGSQHARPWVDTSNRCTAFEDRSIHSSMLIANAIQIAQTVTIPETSSERVLRHLISQTEDEGLRSRLESLVPLLAKQKGVVRTARALGWGDGIPRSLEAIATMSIYAWLRYPNRFRFCVERSALLGGECAAVSAIAGALCAAHLGKRSIPPEWRTRLSLFPHDQQWIDDAVHRIKDWPHGVEDIQNAHGEPSIVLGQIVRNVYHVLFRLINGVIRIPAAVLPSKRR